MNISNMIKLAKMIERLDVTLENGEHPFIRTWYFDNDGKSICVRLSDESFHKFSIEQNS